jgi:hypothetical protein
MRNQIVEAVLEEYHKITPSTEEDPIGTVDNQEENTEENEG